MDSDHFSTINSDDFHTIIYTSIDGFLLVDLEGKILETNGSYCQMVGYSRDEILKLHIPAIDAVDNRDDVLRRFELIIQNGSLRFETKHLHKNGTIIDVEVSANYSASHGGSIFSFIRDISSQKYTREIMAARLRLIEFSLTHSLSELLQQTLDEAEALTGSCIGFYHFKDPDSQMLTLRAWSTKTIKMFCKVEGSDSHYPVSQAGVWVDCIRERRPVIHNDYESLPHKKGLPDGHARVVRELVVPIFRNNNIVAIMGVGNKATDYTNLDVEVISTLADLAWDVAERKRSEEAMKMTRLSVEVASDALFWITPDAGIVDVNEAACRSLGYTRKELLQLKVQDVDIHFNAELWPQHFADLLQQGSLTFESEQSDKDGRVFPVEIVANYVKLGGEDYNCAFVRDITERKKTEAALMASEERWKFAIEGAGDGLWDWNVKTGEAYYSPRYKEMYGYADADIGTTSDEWSKRIHPDDAPGVFEVLQPYMEGRPGSATVEYRMLCKDGNWKWTLGRGMVISRDTDGKPMRMIGTNTDITERKLAEEALRHSEEKFRNIVESSPLAMYFYHLDNDENLVLTGANPSADKVIGVCHKTLLGKRIEDAFPNLKSTNIPEMYRNVAKGLLGHQSFEIIYSDDQISGAYDVHVYQTDPASIAVDFTDITERKRAEEEHLNLEKQLLHAQKLESLGVLAGGIAHDFNNLLMAIMGNADLALMRLNPESPAVDNIKRIEQASARAADLAKQMLAYSGKGKFVVEHLNMSRLLEEMIHMLEVSISKKAVLRFNLASPIPSVEADATQMRQIIMNLVINASEAIGDKSGVISITSGCMEFDRNYLKNVWLDENLTGGLYVYLEISDTGCGMDKDTLSKLFDPFFTTKFTGRGLGMAAVLGIIRGHKGAIKVYSELNKGTSFKILLPASDRPAELFNGTVHTDDWKGSGKVLLVDDEVTVRAIGSEMLRELGFQVITADDGRDGLVTYKQHPDTAFVIMDLTMPHMDGEQCFRELRQLNPDVKVILSSGFSEHEVTQKFAGKGLAGFIQKPYKLSKLKEAVKNIS